MFTIFVSAKEIILLTTQQNNNIMTTQEMQQTINKRIELLKTYKEVQDVLKTMSEAEGKQFLIDTAISTLLGL